MAESSKSEGKMADTVMWLAKFYGALHRIHPTFVMQVNPKWSLVISYFLFINANNDS